METASLRQVEEALKPQGFYVTSPLSEQLAEEPRLREITRFFSSLANRTFGDQDDFCRRLHEAIAREAGIQVRALHCVTSQALHEQPPQYAHEFDVLTLEPIGLKYQIWLDFSGKPAFLKPDCCATKTYVENQALLGKYLLAGEQPEAPSALAHACQDACGDWRGRAGRPRALCQHAEQDEACMEGESRQCLKAPVAPWAMRDLVQVRNHEPHSQASFSKHTRGGVPVWQRAG
jgi:hypothetical protein